ncbi:MAG TPA: outer membrane beta-barrel protein [Bradyrhizobium sp.]|uniref:outer membrane protein n=1 Tax=Bradyrhizobium sp. TaxID=376 RepID=UPI002BFE4E75|nr:outer membrane beta-barrel protein [Bradyrhizobium sp.]HLZ00915.1 outer membrane beta-barrel protein [Bradyrhizobium sp.]
MKNSLLGIAGLVAAISMASPASAADLAARPYTKAPAMIAAAYDWSGFYIGLNGGGGSARKCWDIVNDLGVPVVPAFREGCHDATGGMVGGQLGYRWQSASWVFGVEAQGDWADFKGSNTSLFFGPGTVNQTKVDALGLFTGQVGYAWNNVLWYVKGGAAVVDDKYRGLNAVGGAVFDQANDTRWGGTVGTGVEVSFALNWSVAFEYDHLFMGSRNINFASTTAPFGLSRIDSIKQDADIGSVRVNYRWGGPVIAKY